MNKSTNFVSSGLSVIKGNKPKFSNNEVTYDTNSFHKKFNETSKRNLDEDFLAPINNLSKQYREIKTFQEIASSIPKTYITTIKKSDDVAFAQNEVDGINHKLDKIKMNKLKIWDKKPNTNSNEDKEMNIRKKLFEIKKNVKEKGGLENLDLKNQTYFNKQHLDIILESTRLIKEKAIQNTSSIINGKQNSLNNFIIDNREISMKNFLLNLLKSEISNISSREDVVEKALKESENKLEGDTKLFENFTEKEKSKLKFMEKALFEAAKENRELADKKKKLNQENKQIMDELDRTVKMILNLKGYASFVHTVVGDTKSIRFRDDINILDPKNFDYVEATHKDKDIEKMTEALMDEFSYVGRDSNETPKILVDHTLMISTFLELEENILKLMESKQNIDKETEKIATENKNILRDLEQKEREVMKERDKLYSEKEKEHKIIKDLMRSAEGEGNNHEIVKKLRDIYFITMYEEDYESYFKNKRVKSRPIFDIKELMDKLRKIEFDIIDYIDILEQISKENEEKFKEVIQNRKEYNKYRKQQDIKKKSEAIANLKKEKAEERMHRVVVKGRNPMEHRLAAKGETKKNMLTYNNKGNDDYNMLYYDFND